MDRWDLMAMKQHQANIDIFIPGLTTTWR